MCGITGIFSRSGPIANAGNVLACMLASIEYRGPDESGMFIGDHLAIGNVRLSIIDIKTGQQPLVDPSGRYVIVFNGEIFNYPELREELTGKGHHFRTESDTEVLLQAYIQYGPACLSKCNGQFALAIWDRLEKKLFLARDRLGIRPLFYTYIGDHFVFGSEIKALFEHPGIQPEIDPVALAQVFTCWTTLSPRTFFKNISELPPGHYMTITRKAISIKQFWKLSFHSGLESVKKINGCDAGEQLEELLSDSVKIRLRSDVPVAAYLSGGLDSSAITALIKKQYPEKLQTFSIGFEDEEFDESPYQKEVSAFLDTRHTSFTCSRKDIAALFPSALWHAEMPVLRTAPVPMYCLAKHVHASNIKVVMTGEGADEMLGGYDIFKETLIREFWARQPQSIYRPLLLQKLYPYLDQFKEMNRNMLRFFYSYKLNEVDSPVYSHLLRWHNTSGLFQYFSNDLVNALHGYNFLDNVSSMLPGDFKGFSRLGKAQWLESVIFMSGYLLSSQGDRVAMAHSVEGRYPFLDYRVVEFAAKLPTDLKLHGLNEKYILKKIMEGRLPQRIVKRPKQAYRAPMAKSFLGSGEASYAMELLSENAICATGLFNPAIVQRLVDKIRNAPFISETENMAFTGILSCQVLIRQYIHKTDFRPGRKVLQNLRIIHDADLTFLN